MFGVGEDFIYNASTWVLPVLIAITFHEAAHGFIAWRLGDPTARMAGRLSFNPLRHVDPFGTVVLPAMLYMFGGFLFGWAKPVPVDFRRLHNPRRDMIWVALAGPGTNVVLAVAAALLLHATGVVPGEGREWVIRNLLNAIQINLVLAVFNMIPIPPLDGSRVAAGLMPVHMAWQYARIERYGMLILIGLLFILPMLGNQLGLNLNILGWLVGKPVMFLMQGLLEITGLI